MTFRRIFKSRQLASKLRDANGKPLPIHQALFNADQDANVTHLSMMGIHLASVNSKSLVSEVMAKKSSSLIRWVPFVPKGSLFPSEGEDESKYRLIVRQAMRKDHVATMNSLVKERSKFLLDYLNQHPVIDDVYSFALQQTSKCVGILTYGNTAPDSITDPVDMTFSRMAVSVIPMLRFIPLFGLRKAYKEGQKHSASINAHLEQIKKDNKEGANEKDFCLLTQMHRANEANGNIISDKELLSNAFGMGVGGNDSTASAVASVLFMLAEHPACQQTLRKEIQDATDLDHNSLKKLPYLHAVIQETLRLFPPFSSSLVRYSEKDEIIDGINIPAGLGVIPCLVAANRNIVDFGDDAHEWKPERYLDGSSAPAHVSFGVGPRSCIARGLALSILRQWIADIVSSFEITRTDNK
eukprot:CAMPEP_0117012980 /NCGR_PEP_ID=MMETSP0472-20121206/10794_1 /TAXON_ID=693140 ORGANISM="Tiarina fusus, Strain LIS" /NCGR_SAMPLE_ID=MMETSP0472 /ASSEMBLY_ACC=CAM_ASM_000603 /LENGTH=410 /DNA_ID=CAMNT_0004716159 /DNA_START=96 /DNA_END=1325 /DNA_ORIENTATION=+